MSDGPNMAMRVRQNVRKEMERLQGLISRTGPKFADGYTRGKIDALQWVEMNLTLELDQVLGNSEKMKEETT